jgi:hypothetical protein
MFVCSGRKRTMLAVDAFISVKERTGVHSSIEVSLHKDKLDDTPRVVAELVS